MGRIYLYKMVADDGGAPCVVRGLLSLAICKPMIRARAQKGDVIFGFAANSLNRDRRNRLIYAAKVTKTLPNGEYYKTSHYSGRNDRIYRFQSGRFTLRHNARYHLKKGDLNHDLGEARRGYRRARVLLSDDFRYFGVRATDEYRAKFREVGRAIERLARGHRVHHSAALYRKLHEMKDWLWQSTHKKVSGGPTEKPSSGVCHRGGSCTVIRAKSRTSK
jgi:hypothetical protein